MGSKVLGTQCVGSPMHLHMLWRRARIEVMKYKNARYVVAMLTAAQPIPSPVGRCSGLSASTILLVRPSAATEAPKALERSCPEAAPPLSRDRLSKKACKASNCQ